MSGADAAHDVAERYARFARDEAPGRSALYASWARGVAADADAQRLLSRIPAHRRQPPLVFGVARMLGAPEAGYEAWMRWLVPHIDDVARECVARGLQTNEPQRCAALLPALSDIEGPVALLEVGASAGLCLLVDRYSYRYGDGQRLDPAAGPSALTLEVAGAHLPSLRMPTVVWRAGIDVTPVDAASAVDQRFLESLVWPGETGRRERIRAAMHIAALDPPAIVQADATGPGVLREVAAHAPPEATLVVTTPGVMPHIPRAGREAFALELSLLRADRPDMRWITIDPAGLHPSPDASPAPAASPAHPRNGFVLAVDGAAVADVDPLGSWVEWRAGDV